MQTTILMIRHGQTAMNHAKLLQGRSDIPLNETGRQQACAAGAALKEKGIVFDHVFSSPLQRAVETASLIAGADQNVITDERLIEMDYGPYEGMDLTKPDEAIRTFFSDFVHNPAPEGMEQLDHVTARLGNFLEEIKARGISGNILISTHAIALKGALEYLSPDSGGSYWSKYIGNCAVYVSNVENGAFTVPQELKL
jgi:broad specificity phosphatase PhoE